MMSEQDIENLDSNESDSLSDLSPLSASLQVSVKVFPYSNCANVIISPVFFLEDVAYGVYVTARRIDIASE